MFSYSQKKKEYYNFEYFAFCVLEIATILQAIAENLLVEIGVVGKSRVLLPHGFENNDIYLYAFLA